jgi:NAD(P)-dependent dehydrogenase (short-subunit alcohol dehydrogenase family)
MYVVTGAASGIGAATRALLESRGHTVLGVDLRDAEVVADLGTPAGRARARAEVERHAPDGIDGFVPCAGLAGETGGDPALLVSVNYFGAVDLAVGLHPLLARAADRGGAPGVVLLSSNSVTAQPGWPRDLAEACLAGDEQKAREVAAAGDAFGAYPASKAALAWWARREGIRPEWAGAGIRLNAVAPGLIATPMTDRVRQDPTVGAFVDAYPSALDRPGRPEEVAAVIAFLLSAEASLLVGSVVFVDGGTDALIHPTRPEPMAGR